MRRALLTFVVAALAVAAVSALPPAGAEDGYDAVIYEAPDGSTHIDRDGTDEVLASGSCVVSLSEVEGSYSVLMRSGTLESLTILCLDDGGAAPASVDFVMESGSVGTLVGVSAGPGYQDADAAGTPVSGLSIEVRGHVGELDPCEAAVGVGSMEVSVGRGGSVDRLRSTGTAGTVADATVSVLGGTVGYMANGSSVVSGLEYRLLAGEVEYLCLGSDTQSGGGTLSSLPTFCATGTVEVYTTSAFSAGVAIVGAGVVDLPAVLSDGSSTPSYASRTVVVDAPLLEISGCTYFQSGGRALTFSDYAIGGSPSTAAVRTQVSSGSSSVALYGDGGVWGSRSGGTVSDLSSVYLNTTFTVEEGSELAVSANGFLTNARFLRVEGSLSVDGLLVNNGVVELVGDGALAGEVSGSGYVANSVTVDASAQPVGVRSTLDAVVVHAKDGTAFADARVYVSTSEASVTVSASEPLDLLFVSVTRLSSDDTGTSYGIHVAGYRDGTGVQVSSTVTVPFPNDGEEIWVVGSDGCEAEISDVSVWEVTFDAGSGGVYTVTTEEPDSGSSQIWVDVAIAAAIIILAAIIVYMLLRRDTA